MMSSKKQTPQSTTKTNNYPDFQIPSKERKIIPILMPKQDSVNESNDAAIITHAERPQLSGSSKPFALAKVPKPSVGSAFVHSFKFQGYSSSTQQLSSSNRQISSLDIYSPSYVPLWLQAANDSFAEVKPCPRFPVLDFGMYISSFVGSDFVREVPAVPLPPLIHNPTFGTELTFENYASFWLSHLQNEFAAQNIQYSNFRLYNQRLQSDDGRPNFYTLQVPGLRENAPRVDLADIVHIRPLLASNRHVESQLAHWLEHGKQRGIICPGFSGLLYNPQVWELDRARGMITLRIDGYDNSSSCNVVFLLQESKLEPICRAVQTASMSSVWLRRMLFPDVKDGVLQSALSQANFDIPWIDDLNWEQKKAVYTIFTANYGNIPYLISGPPGTGKTKTIVEATLQLIRKPGHLLVCAPSDAAADTIALRLSAHLQPDKLFRLISWTRAFAEVPDRLLLYTHSEGPSFSLPPPEKLLAFLVVVTTCRDADMLNRARLTNVSLAGLFNGVKQLVAPGSPRHALHWTALLLDEAAQATEPDVLIPLTVVIPPSEHESPLFVAAGDQYQLGPKLSSGSVLEVSLFQRLFDRKAYSEHPLSRKHRVKAITSSMLPMMRPPFTNLIRNYRSHPAILSVPSLLFYNDTLITERKSSTAIISWPGWNSEDRWPVLFCQNDSSDDYESITQGDGTGYGTLHNPGEANVAVNIAMSLLRHANCEKRIGLAPKDIMVMSPFRAQVALLRKIFRQNNLFEVNIGPLEAFQGLESRIVIICTTRTRVGTTTQSVSHHVAIDKTRGLGVIDEPRRLNVAMTRAQEGLIVIGNVHCLVSTRDNQWLNFLDYCRRNKCFNAAANFVWPDLGGPYNQGRLERALIYATLGKVDFEHQQQTIQSIKQTDSDRRNAKFRLKGLPRDMDQEMWQFKELVQRHDSESIDLVLPNGHDQDDEKDIELTYDYVKSHTRLANVFDRDLKQEFHRECTTQ